MKSILKKLLIILFVIIVNIANVVYASPSDIYNNTTGNGIVSAGQYIAGWIRYGAVAIAVGVLMVKGIKFLISSPEGKADAKKEMIPWAIGVVILFSMNVIINFVAKIANNNLNGNISVS